MSAENLDARLLRFRLDSKSEDPNHLAGALLAADRAGEALEVVGSRLGEQPKDVDALVLAGRAWMERGDLLRAQKTLLQAARFDAAHPDPYRWLGEVLLRRGDPDRAQKVLARARALGALDPEVRRLHERATRLARIASDSMADADEDGTTSERPLPDAEVTRRAPEPVPPAAKGGRPAAAAPAVRSTPSAASPPARAEGLTRGAGRPSPFDDADDLDEATVVASNLSEQIAAASRRRDSDMPEAVDDDAPTSMLDRDDLAAVNAAQRGGPTTDDPFGADPFGADPFGVEPPTTVKPKLAPAAPPRTAAAGAGAAAARAHVPAAAPARAPAPVRAVAAAPSAPAPAPDPFQVEVAGRAEEDFDDAFDGELGDSLEADLPEPAFADDGARPAPSPDLAGGDALGRAENVDVILDMLHRERLFEPPGEAAGATQWAAKKESKASGTRVGVPLVVAWVLAAGLAVGGFFGWQAWVAHQDAEAVALVDEARERALRGTHQALVDAERMIRQARELSPQAEEGPTVLLFVHTQRALEDGAFEPGFLQSTVERAGQAGMTGPRLDIAHALIAFARGDAETGDAKLAAALESGADDPTVRYAAGRLGQRLARDDATEQLEAALALEPALASAAIALAEGLADAGQPTEALARIEAVLERHEGHLRATLWKGLLEADDAEPEPALAAVGALEGLDHGAPADQVLHALTRARLLRRLGRTEEATAAIQSAASAGATEPRLQALTAMAAQAVGDLARAQQAAMAAVAGAPAIPEYRKLLAEILVARRDGVRALRTLGHLSADDPEVLALSARAALIVGTEDTLTATAEALDGYLEGEPDPSVEMRALRIRVGVRLGDAARMVDVARRLARDAPGDPEAGMAVAEAALEARDARLATEALERVTTAAPMDAEAHYLLGRARRMGGDAEGAEAALQRTLELQAGHGDAQIMLGYLFLDAGKYEEADALYQTIATRVGQSGSGRSFSSAGRLGRIEALIGLGRVADAKVQAESLRDAERNAAITKVVLARLALADGRSGEAVQLLRPMASAEDAGADIIALYGEALYAAGETLAAAETFERAMAIDAGHPEALVGYATSLVRGEKYREAGEILSRAAAALDRRIRPPALRARMLSLRGRVGIERGSRDAAIRDLRAATELFGAPTETWFYLGEALAGRSSPDARAAYEGYLERAPNGPLASRARRAIR